MFWMKNRQVFTLDSMFWMKNRQLCADLGAIKWFWANVFFCDVAQSDNHP
jgi:hypothetical protein